jgi:CspA family cold shock protein
MRTRSLKTGTVKWFNPTKGYGFIQPDGGGADAFVHISAVERAGYDSLSEGQRVQYELVQGRNGKSSAENLKIVGDRAGSPIWRRFWETGGLFFSAARRRCRDPAGASVTHAVGAIPGPLWGATRPDGSAATSRSPWPRQPRQFRAAAVVMPGEEWRTTPWRRTHACANWRASTL